MTAGEAQQPDHEQRIGALEGRMDTAETRLDNHDIQIQAHDVMYTRLNEIFTYSRNTWLVVKWFGIMLGIIGSAITVASYAGWIG